MDAFLLYQVLLQVHWRAGTWRRRRKREREREKRREEGRKREAELRSSLGDTSPYVLVSAPAAAGRYHLGSLRAKTFTMRLESIEPSSQRCSCQYCTARRSAH